MEPPQESTATAEYARFENNRLIKMRPDIIDHDTEENKVDYMKPYEQFIDGDVNAEFIYNGTGANLISNTINSRENTQKNKFLGVDKKNPVKESIERFAETAEEENMNKMFHEQTTECLKPENHVALDDGTDTNEQKNEFLGVDKENLAKKPLEMFAETAEEENMKKKFHVQTTECLKTGTHGNSNDGTDTNEQARYVDRKMEGRSHNYAITNESTNLTEARLTSQCSCESRCESFFGEFKNSLRLFFQVLRVNACRSTSTDRAACAHAREFTDSTECF